MNIALVNTDAFMRKMQFLVPGIILLLATSCSSSKTITQKTEKPKEEASIIRLDSLKATNLSEDATVLSSGNDEILLTINFFVKEGSIYVNRYNKFYGQWVFDKKNMARAIGDKFQAKKKAMKDGILIVTLVELDQENRENILNEELKTELLAELNENGGTINEAKIEPVLRGNDLLGIKLIRLNEVNPKEIIVTDFTGTRLMDKYFYSLSWQLF